MVLTYCTEEKNKYEKNNIIYEPKAKLNLVEKLYHHCNDNFFVGKIYDVEVIQNRIYISDATSCQVHVFNDSFEHLYSSAECGRGPDEFDRVPLLTKDKNHLIAYGIGDMRNYYILDDNLKKISSINTPNDYFSEITNPVFFPNKIVISALSDNPLIKNKNKDMTVAVMVKRTSQFIKPFCSLDPIYLSNTTNSYTNTLLTPLLAHGFNNSVVVLQGASTVYNIFNNNGNYVGSYNYKPRFYKIPPHLSTNQVRNFNSKERFENFYSKISAYKKMFFDEKNKLLYICYYNLTEESIRYKTHIGVLSYLIVINSKYRCIYDDKIEGYMTAVENGYIYTVVNEGDTLQLNKYSINIL